MPSNIFFLILSLFIFCAVLMLVRSQKMKEKYAALWLIISAITIVLALFPSLLSVVTGFTGVVMPVNLLFLLAIIMLMGVCMHLTLELSKVSDEVRTLAEEIAILKAETLSRSEASRTPGIPLSGRKKTNQ
ncbi:DUF2304 domain-containing protein [Rothia sp. ZJ1223]|uniref:DUF2304 domain-containing protein n=1 Tax=Rothia sp. ZJ1223 TaxID=2811098 RepID=UPI00195CCFBC|nr:DUF2304 domain-containing protein [Rothia sp. ZJ1223]MBM7051758.1 DUF2304 domain-containing protein [Rothia sp. ZJ1223]